MCRSIKVLRQPAPEAASEADVRAAALQYVRKVSGYRQPSRANTAAFESAVDEVARATDRLLKSLAVAADTTTAGRARSELVS